MTSTRPLFVAILGFLIAGGVVLKWAPRRVQLGLVAAFGVPAIFQSAALVAGANTARVPVIFFGIALAVAAGVFVIRTARSVMPFLLEILATIPSVVYGMWGIFVLAPFIATHAQPTLKIWQAHFDQWFGKGNFPIFQFRGFPTGLGLGTAILVLTVMILPLIVSISLDAMRAVPVSYREAALGLGATRWEMIRMAVLPPARSGIFGGCILALGRALGETMAVTMVIGNDPSIRWSFLRQANTISSIIANEYTESEGLKRAALMELALILFAMTLGVNLIARYLTRRMGVNPVVK